MGNTITTHDEINITQITDTGFGKQKIEEQFFIPRDSMHKFTGVLRECEKKRQFVSTETDQKIKNGWRDPCANALTNLSTYYFPQSLPTGSTNKTKS